MAKMPAELVGPDKALYLAALKNAIPMYSTTGLMDPKGAEAVLRVFSQSSPDVAKARIDLSKTYTNRFVEQAARKLGLAVVAQRRAPAGQARLCAAGRHTSSRRSTMVTAASISDARKRPARTCRRIRRRRRTRPRPAGSGSRGPAAEPRYSPTTAPTTAKPTEVCSEENIHDSAEGQ